MTNPSHDPTLDAERAAFDAWLDTVVVPDGCSHRELLVHEWSGDMGIDHAFEIWKASAAEPRTEFICGRCMLRQNARKATNEPAF